VESKSAGNPLVKGEPAGGERPGIRVGKKRPTKHGAKRVNGRNACCSRSMNGASMKIYVRTFVHRARIISDGADEVNLFFTFPS
jgi:hypothetical protein